jgi:hypothetical protein
MLPGGARPTSGGTRKLPLPASVPAGRRHVDNFAEISEIHFESVWQGAAKTKTEISASPNFCPLGLKP